MKESAMDLPSCLICLEPPEDISPLYLLSCGCKVGWFHEACEREWLNRTPFYEGVPPCPVCKRIPRMKTNFSFASTAGPAQAFLWQTLWLLGGEVCISFSLFFAGGKWALVLPVQSYALLLTPFVIPCHNDILFFLQRLRYKYFLFLVYAFIRIGVYQQLLHTKANESSTHLALLGCFYTGFFIFIQMIQISYPSTHPLLPFAISRDIRHADVLPKTMAGSLKGLK